MSGVKGRSGPPGHLHNAKYPWRSFWRRRALKAEDRWILPVLEGYSGGLLSDRPDASEAERRCVEVAQIARGASMLILAEAARSGFIKKENGSWDLAPGAKELARFLGIERASLQTLGLGRRARPVQTLDDYLTHRAQDDESDIPS
jgi:hypothetical protein